jgi:hypothetical protein
VYAVGHLALTRSGRFLAATLACGEGAALSRITSRRLSRQPGAVAQQLRKLLKQAAAAPAERRRRSHLEI